jgi:hypothetical protein
MDEATEQDVPGASGMLPAERPAWYVIRVAGELSPPSGAGLDGLRISTSSQAGPVTTVLVGMLQDQAALLRVLRVLHGYRLTLLDLACLPAHAVDAEGRRQSRG